METLLILLCPFLHCVLSISVCILLALLLNPACWRCVFCTDFKRLAPSPLNKKIIIFWKSAGDIQSLYLLTFYLWFSTNAASFQTSVVCLHIQMPLYLEYQKIKQFVSNAESLHHAFLTPAPAATGEKNADQQDSVRHVEPVSRTDSQPPEFLLFCFVWLLRELCWLQLSRLNGSQFPIKNAWCPMHACFCIFPSRAVFFSCRLCQSLGFASATYFQSNTCPGHEWHLWPSENFLMWCDWAQMIGARGWKQNITNAFFTLTVMETLYHFLNTLNMCLL